MLSKIPPFPGHSDPQSTAPSGGGGADIRVTQITASGGIFFSSEFPGDCPILRETGFTSAQKKTHLGKWKHTRNRNKTKRQSHCH